MNIDANQVLEGLLDEISAMAKENAMLKVQLKVLLDEADKKSTPEEAVADGSESIQAD